MTKNKKNLKEMLSDVDSIMHEMNDASRVYKALQDEYLGLDGKEGSYSKTSFNAIREITEYELCLSRLYFSKSEDLVKKILNELKVEVDFMKNRGYN